MQENQKFRDLPLFDPLMFKEVMSQKDLSQMFLGELLQRKIPALEHIDSPCPEGVTGIPPAVYLKDAAGSHYFIAVPNTCDGLELMSRYVHSCLDNQFFQKHGPDADPPKNYVILVCNFDFAGDGVPKHTAESYLQGENGLTIPYDDGRYTIVLNTQYRKEDGVSPAILEFLAHFRDEDAAAVEFKTALAQKLRERTKAIRENKGE